MKKKINNSSSENREDILRARKTKRGGTLSRRAYSRIDILFRAFSTEDEQEEEERENKKRASPSSLGKKRKTDSCE